VQTAAFCIQAEEGCEDVGIGVVRELEGLAMELRAGWERVGQAGGGLEREGEGEVGGVVEEGVNAEGAEVQAGGGDGAEEEREEVGEEVEAEEAAVEELHCERWEVVVRAYAGD
jgi:hypothetical protein